MVKSNTERIPLTWKPVPLGRWLKMFLGMGLLLSGLFLAGRSVLRQSPSLNIDESLQPKPTPSPSPTSDPKPDLFSGGHYTIYQGGGGYGFYQGELRREGETSPDASYIIQRVFELARGGGKIVLQKGVYRLSRGLVIREGWHFYLEGDDEYSTILLYSGEPALYILQLQGNNQGTRLSGFTLSGSEARVALIVNTTSYQSLVEFDHLQIGWNYRYDEWGGEYERTDFGLFVYMSDVLRVSDSDIYGNDVAVRIGSGTDMFFTDTDFAVLPIGGEKYRIGFWANTVANDGWGMRVFEGTVYISRCTNNAPLSTGYLLRSFVHLSDSYMENGRNPLVCENAVFNVENSNFMSEPGTVAVINAMGSTGFFENNFVTIHPENTEIMYLLAHSFDTPTGMINFKDNRVFDYAGNLPAEYFLGNPEHRVTSDIIIDVP